MRLIAAVLAGLVAFAPVGAGADDPAPVHGIAMHGEPKYPPGFPHFDYVNPDAPKGGAVKLSATGSFDTFNPFVIKGQAAAGIGSIYDTLTVPAADEAFSRYGLLAESMEVPEDRSWVIFNLRPEARWHDGTPVTADDVVFTFEIRMERGDPQFRYYYASVDRVEKLGPRRIRFTFKPGENRELPLILADMVVLPKHYWEGRDFEETTLEPPLGSGPYEVEAFEAGRWVRYARVEDYWGRDLAVNVGTDNFDTIQYDYYRDRTVSLEAMKAGAFDFRLENFSKAWATAYDIPAVRRGVLIKETIEHDRAAGMQGFVYNTRRFLFQDRRVRRALAYAFDFNWSNQNLFYGQYTRSRSYFDNSELAARGLPDARELEILEPYRGRIPDEVFTAEYAPPDTEVPGRIRSNLREAVALLDAAGWAVQNGKRVHTETGTPMAFEILLVSPQFERIVLPFAKNLERLGIEVGVRTVDTAQYIKRLETFDFDMITFVWGQSLSPGNEQRSFWGSDAAERPGSRNFAGIQDPVVDELIELLIAAPDRESLIVRTRALDRVLQWGHYVVPHWHIDYDRLVYWDKFGHPEVTPTRGSQFGTWWVDAERAATLEDRKRQASGN